MRLTIVVSDKFIKIDNNSMLDIQQDFSWIPENVHAVQWYETYGEVEFTDGSPNEEIHELGIYSQAIDTFNSELDRIKEEEEEREAARDYWEELRQMRTSMLYGTDWTQLLDSNLSEEKKEEWRIYRQQLRDLPQNTEDPKNPIWPSVPT